MKTLVTLVIFCLPSQAATITVDVNGGGDHIHIQSAIDQAADGDIVLVSSGLYVIRESINFNRLYDPENPDGPPLKNIVVRSTSGAERTTILRVSDGTWKHDKVNAVVFQNGEDEESRLIGFRVAGQWPISGDGVFCANRSSPTIAGCILSENIGNGLMCVDYSSPSIIDCTISRNSDGGVCCVNNSAPNITNCLISQNFMFMGGGVFCQDNSAPTISNCTILGNWAIEAGGGVFCQDSSTPKISNCRIWGNVAGLDGGGVAGGAILTNCTIAGNVGCVGGAIGVGLSAFGRYPRLINCTIAGNGAAEGMGGLPCGVDDCFSDVVNCIIWGNSPESLCNGVPGCSTTLDPLFVSEGSFDLSRMVWVEIAGRQEFRPDFIIEPPDYHLRSGSPAIDIADPLIAIDTDIEGNVRPCWKGVDMGAHEYCGDVEPVPLPQFNRGDANASGAIDIADAIFLLSHLFAQGPAPSCKDAGDANDSRTIDIADAIAILSHLFAQAGPLPPPFGSCGVDPTMTDDTLGCASFPPCQ